MGRPDLETPSLLSIDRIGANVTTSRAQRSGARARARNRYHTTLAIRKRLPHGEPVGSASPRSVLISLST